jgi:hypothetical protein
LLPVSPNPRQVGVLADRTQDDPFDFFAAIYCLNLDQHPDRWEHPAAACLWTERAVVLAPDPPRPHP